jgi:O-methyltransferase
MRINFYKLLAPDFAIGKIIVFRKSVADSLRLLIRKPTAKSWRFAKLMLRVKPQFTMVTNKNLLTLYELVEDVNKRNLPGDIVECGVWNGGSAVTMAIANRQTLDGDSSKRTLWLFDSFEGLPPAGEKDGEGERQGYFPGWNKGNSDNVKRIFNNLGVPLDQVRIVPGWFESTLKNASMGRIAVLHVDADWYESVKLVLDVFYDKVVPGGYVILNDYGTWKGCNQAVEEFLLERDIQDVRLTIVEPRNGAYFQKPMD